MPTPQIGRLVLRKTNVGWIEDWCRQTRFDYSTQHPLAQKVHSPNGAVSWAEIGVVVWGSDGQRFSVSNDVWKVIVAPDDKTFSKEELDSLLAHASEY